MARKSKIQSKRSSSGAGAAHGRWRSSLTPAARGGLIRGTIVLLAALSFVLAVSVAMARLDAHVDQRLRERFDRAYIVFADLPPALVDLAQRDLYDSVDDVLARPWTDPSLCRQVAERLAEVPWVASIHAVRRTPDARFVVRAAYRAPAALVQHGGGFYLVDEAGVRLPGAYPYDPQHILLQGVASRPPPPGEVWSGVDLRAGLAIVAAISAEPYRDQITAVLVGNVGGRKDPGRSHVELATDRAGGRIWWGSAPGAEMEENTVDQKLAILRANFQLFGRVDAGHPVIDVSTFPDRFTIPG